MPAPTAKVTMLTSVSLCRFPDHKAISDENGKEYYATYAITAPGLTLMRVCESCVNKALDQALREGTYAALAEAEERSAS